MIDIDFGKDFQNVDDPTQVELSKENKDKIASLLRTEWRQFTVAIRPLLEDDVAGWRLYHSASPLIPKNKVKGKGDSLKVPVNLGITGRVIESVMAQQHNTTFPAEEQFFSGKPLNKEAQELQNIYESFASSNIAQADFDTQAYNLRVNAAIAGTALASCHFARKKGHKVRYETEEDSTLFGDAKTGILTKVKEPSIEWEGTLLKALSFHDWRVDPFCEDFQEAALLVRWYQPAWKVKKEYKLDEAKTYGQVKESASDSNYAREKGLAAGIDWSFSEEEESEGLENALLMCRWGDFVVDGEVYENHCALVLNDTETLWFGPNPYDHGKKPYVLTPYYGVSGSLYGKSLLRDILGSAQAIDRSVTQVLDIMEWAASPAWTKNINDNAVKAQGDLKVVPGIHIPVTTEMPYKQLQVNLANTNNLMALMGELEKGIQESTGATPAYSGESTVGSGSQPTAFQVGQSVQGGNSRHQSRMNSFNNRVLQPFIEMKFENDRQFMTKSYELDGFAEPLTPEDVKQMDMVFTLTAGKASLSKNEKIQNQMSFAEKLIELKNAGVPIQFSQDVYVFDACEMASNLGQEIGITDAENVFKKMDQVPAAVEVSGMGGIAGIPQTEQGLPPELAAQLAQQPSVQSPPL